MISNRPEPRSLHNFLLGFGGALVFVAMAVQLALGGWFAGKIYPGVAVAGIPVGGLTRLQAQDRLSHQVTDYKVRLQVGSRSFNITPQELGTNYNLAATVDQAYGVGRDQWFLPWALFQPRQPEGVGYAFVVDQPAKEKFIDKIVKITGQAPLDAVIIINNGVPEAKSDENGVAIEPSDVEIAIDHQISNLSDVPIKLQPNTQLARIHLADVKPAIEQTKVLLAVPVTITYQGQTFKPSAADMSGWITYDKTPVDQPAGLIPKLSTDGIKFYLQSVAQHVNVNPTNRKVRIENGDSSETQAGKDGIQLDQDALADQIAKAVTAKQPITVEAPTKPVPFKTEYNRVISLDYGKYIEINLSMQHLWVYQDHNVIYESPITSGATGAGFGTVTGLFSIQAKQTNRNLNGYAIGYNYNVHVDYWMPFYGNYGLHDASWRSSFGGPDYWRGGSHGCVNLPLDTAAFLYGWSDVGTPVWIHN